ncbi:MAG: ribonuclease R [Azospirillaceae bacterium]
MSTRKTPFPTRAEIVAFVNEHDTPVHKREIARAFHIHDAEDKRRLKALLKELQDEGRIGRDAGKRLASPEALPAVMVLTVVAVDLDGETIAAPTNWRREGAPPRIIVMPDKRGHAGLAEGDRLLARLSRLDTRHYEARVIRKLDRPRSNRVIGVIRDRGRGAYLQPADKRDDREYRVADSRLAGAGDGDIVAAELHRSRGGPPDVAVLEVLGRADDPRSISLIAIATAGIPVEFPRAAVEQAEQAKPPALGKREDLRRIPLVTIDGADARDFDDAVHAQPDDDPQNEGGWQLLVAIADVSAYVDPDSPLDREAFRRGNSVYFPDRVVPMLPEALSNGLCSLVPGEDRACLAVRIAVDSGGQVRDYRFTRGLMRSAARLTYEQVQAAVDGQPDDTTSPLLDPVLKPLYGAYRALDRAREKRGTLDLDIPERTVAFDPQGRITGFAERQRLDSHKLIEEFMIAANVAAARALTERRTGTLFRVHDAPDRAKLMALKEFLAPYGYTIALGQVIRPRMFAQVLKQAAGRPEAPAVSELILRAQAQARYEPENIGHFGLALPAYCHFTSPIRRYADLVVHRGLVRALSLGHGGLTEREEARLDEIGEQVSTTERTAASAERDAMDRYVSAYLSGHVGEAFQARISSVTRFGLFVSVDPSGADGLIPISTLPDDYYDHDERAHALVGRRWGRIYRLGARLEVVLVEADPITGSSLFKLARGQKDEGASGGLEAADLPSQRERRPRRDGGSGRSAGRPGKRR